MERAGCHLNVLLLDACRNKPSRMERGARAARSGLAEMRAPAGSVIAFACAAGMTAQDGAGRNGVFTSHLLKHLTKPGVDVDNVLRAVSAGVYEETRQAQDPYHNHNLKTTNVCIVPGVGGLAAAPSLPASAQQPQAPPPRRDSAADAAPELTAFLAQCDLEDDAAALLGSLQALGVRKEKDLLLVDEEMLSALHIAPIAAKKLRAGLAAQRAAAEKAEQERAAAERASAERAAAEKAAAERAAAQAKAAAEAKAAADAEAARRAAAAQAAAAKAAADKAAADRAAAAKAAADKQAADRAAAERVAAAQAAAMKAAADREQAAKAAALKAALDAAPGVAIAGLRGDLGTVVRYLNAHRSVAAAQARGCSALADALGGKNTASPSDGSAEAVMAALRAFPHDREVMMACGSALINMSANSAPMQAKLCAAGALEAVRPALVAHAADEALQLKLLWALRNMIPTDKVASGAVTQGLITAVAASATARVRCKQTCEHGCIVLGSAAEHNRGGMQSQVAAAGGFEFAISALRAHPDDRTLQRVAVYLIYAMLQNCTADVKSRARSAGALQALNEALGRCGFLSKAKELIVYTINLLK
jgi:hypothetical protein